MKESIVGRTWRVYLKPHTASLLLSVLLAMVTAATMALMTRLVQPLVDTILAQRPQSHEGLLLTVLLLSLLPFVRSITRYIGTLIIERLGMKVLLSIKTHMFSSLLRLDLETFLQRGTATFLSRFSHDVTYIQTLILTMAWSLLQNLFLVASLVMVMLSIEWKITLALFIFVPPALWGLSKLGQTTKKLSHRSQENMAYLFKQLDDALKGIKEVKLYGSESYEKERGDHLLRTSYKSSLKMISVAQSSVLLTGFLSSFLLGTFLLWLMSPFRDATLSAGDFVAFLLAMTSLYQPLKNLTGTRMLWSMGRAALERVYTVIDMRPSIVDSPNASLLKVEGGALVFSHVSLSYRTIPALKDISLTVPALQHVAIVGPSGAGKTTLLKLICRLYEATEGHITIDEQDIRHVTQHSLRAAIAFVSQDVWIFSETVRFNLMYGCLHASEEDMLNASRAAACHEFIMDLPQGYDTPVGERGMTLSGGQRQRLSIARALLKKAPLLLLDEATSSLDTRTERDIQKALALLTKNRTTISIAHRLSTIMHADLIYVLDKGHVVAQGTHNELLEQKGLYAHMWHEQIH